MALTTVKSILKDHSVVVLGSAPLSEEAKAFLVSSDSCSMVCVNGAISSTSRPVDLWVLNSREYDQAIYLNPKLWTDERKRLHEIMMGQATGRAVRHILFMLKNDRPDQTISRLQTAGVKWRAYTTLNMGQKTDLVRKAGVHKFATAFNTSAGLAAAALALAFKADKVTLTGFSFQDGYQYLPDAPQGHRLHIEQDKEALEDLLLKHDNRLQVI